MNGTIRIESDKIILRKFTVDDSEAMFRNWASDDHVTKFLTWPTHQNQEETRSLLQSWVDSYTRSDVFNWAIYLKSEQTLVGNISVVHLDKDKKEAEIGFCLGKEWWGRGIIPLAGKMVIHHLLHDCGFQRVYAKHDVNNGNSGSALSKMGMEYEETLKAQGRNNQGIVDECVHGIKR